MKIGYLEWSTSFVCSAIVSLLILSAGLHWAPCPKSQSEHSTETGPFTLGVLTLHQKLTTKPLSNPLLLQNTNVQLTNWVWMSSAGRLPASFHLFQSYNGNFTERMQRTHFFLYLRFFLIISPYESLYNQQEPYWLEFAFPHLSLSFSICANRILLAAVPPPPAPAKCMMEQTRQKLISS